MVEGLGERGIRVADKEGNELHPCLVSYEGRNVGEYFSVFFSILLSQPSSLQKPISTMTRVHCFPSKEIGSEGG